jgi:large subunit ribosomal protein L25
MSNLTLKAQTRAIIGKKVQSLREKKLIPAVTYGHGVKNQNLSLEYIPFEKVYKEGGESTLIDLVVDDRKPVKVLVQEVQKDPLTDMITHVDLRQVKMTEKITIEVLLKFVGEPKAVKELGGVLVKTLDKIKVKCLPQDMAHEIEVDISSLNTFDDIIYVKDLKIPAGLELLENMNEPVINVMPPRSEEELKALEEKVEEKVGEVKTVAEEKKKVEETEAAAAEGKEGKEGKGVKESKEKK